MKKNYFILLLCICAYLSVHCQTDNNKQDFVTISDPQQGLSTDHNLKLDKLELSDSCTILTFSYAGRAGNWIQIPKETYIQSIPDGEKLFVLDSKGIPLEDRYTPKETGNITYSLTFPPIDKSVKHIDYGEANEGGSWHIYDIGTTSQKSTVIPEEVTGNWFNSKKGTWEVGLYDTLAVYRGKVWSYGDVALKKRKGIIHLTSDLGSVDLLFNRDKEGNYQFGTSDEDMVSCSTNTNLLSRPFDNENPYEAPVFKMDSATYCGYINGYTFRAGVKTMMIFVNDILAGNQNSYLINIAGDGSFSVKLPIYTPSECYVRSDIFNGTVYLEPGKQLFQLIASGNASLPLVMGVSAKVNTDLKRISNIEDFDYRMMLDKILDMTPENYKDWCIQNRNIALNQLDSVFKTGVISKKAWLIKKYDLEYTCAAGIMQYTWYFESAYRRKNHIPHSQDSLPIQIKPYPQDYFDFVTNEFVNDSLAPISYAYGNFINTLKYLDLLRDKRISTYDDLGDIQSIIEQAGYTLTDEEKQLVTKIEEGEILKDTDNEYQDSITAFYEKYSEPLTLALNECKNKKFKENLVKLLGVQPGFATDIIYAQDKSREIVKNGNPLSDEELMGIQQSINTPFIGEYMAICNDRIKEKIEENKSKTGYVVNDTPQTGADKLFDSIIDKYKGKVIYVDFWATWCGPCCSGIERIKPLKEEMKDEDIVFVYITTQSSPEGTWKNKIPDIKGEHYRVSTDQWNYLSSKFNISGIPHYVLVGKDGKIINGDLAHMDNNSLKVVLEKYL